MGEYHQLAQAFYLDRPALTQSPLHRIEKSVHYLQRFTGPSEKIMLAA
jgi:hypothetical protein